MYLTELQYKCQNISYYGTLANGNFNEIHYVIPWLVVVFVGGVFFQIGFLCVTDLAILELTLYTRLTSAFQVLGLKAYIATAPQQIPCFLKHTIWGN